MEPTKLVTPAERAARKRARMGLGDAVGTVATPIAAALGLPCVDPATKQLRPESPCARRKAAMNRAGEKAASFVSSLLHMEKPKDQETQV